MNAILSPTVLLLLFASGIAGAAENSKLLTLQCEGLEVLSSRIQFCSDSREAVHSAQLCYEALARAWNNAPLVLNKSLSSATRGKAGTNQEKEFNNSRSDFANTLLILDNLIAVTKANTELLSKYPALLFDTPYMTNEDEQSAPCYFQAIDKIQDIVWDLDEKIHEGESAREVTEKMRAIAQSRDDHVGAKVSLTQLAHGASAQGAATLARMPAALPKNGPSSITGVENDRRKKAEGQRFLNGK